MSEFCNLNSGATAAQYSRIRVGEKYTSSFKIYVTCNGKMVSPFHDVPLYVAENGKDLVFVVNEIPRFENAKFEINKGEHFNPVMQDISSNGTPRFIKNVFPVKGYMWNYGALPQTWEDPEGVDKHTNAVGDGDPVDVIDVGRRRKSVGEVYQAKILGCMALIDEGECDWKIIVIDSADDNACEINDICDVEKFFPGLLKKTLEWFKNYKIPDGKKKNVFGLDGKCMGKDLAMDVIEDAHKSWRKMMSSECDVGIWRNNSTLVGEVESPEITQDFLLREGDNEEILPKYVYEFEFIARE